MADALRAARLRPAFLTAARLHLIETSPALRKAQQQALGQVGLPIDWHDRVDDLPAGPLVIIANEFFDALPIRQFVRTAGGWAERMVGIGEGGGLAFGLRPSPPPPSSAFDAPPGAIVEVSAAASAIMTRIAERLTRDGGAALVIDYGHVGPATGDTLQAVRDHRYADPLASAGEADITAHVDFDALAEAARAAGAVPRPVVTQGDFLIRLGLGRRAERLADGKDEATRRRIGGEAERLAGGAAMGTLFKVLAVSADGLALPVFDDDPEGAAATTATSAGRQ
jgi:SAM-dependent MidA family methyltransferase